MRWLAPGLFLVGCLIATPSSHAQSTRFPVAVPAGPATGSQEGPGPTQDLPVLPAPKPSPPEASPPAGSAPQKPSSFPIPGDHPGQETLPTPQPEEPSPGVPELSPRILTATIQIVGEGVPQEPLPRRVFILDGEYLLLIPRGNPSEVGVANPATGPGQNGYSDSIFIPSGYESGFRVAGSWLNPTEDADFTLRYTYFSWQSDVFRYAPVTNNGSTFFPTPVAASMPSPAATGSSMVPYYGNGGITTTLLPMAFGSLANQVSARSNIIFQFGDIEFGKSFHHEDWLKLRVFGGPRYAYLNQSLQAQYSGGWIQSADYGSSVMFNGGGVRAGASADATLLGRLGVRIWGGASLVAGAYEGRVSQTMNGTGAYTMNETSFGTVPILEGGIGLNIRHKGWDLLIGYEFQSWLNVLQGYTADGYSAYQPRLRKEYGNLGFDGFAGIGVQSKYSW